MRLTTLLLVVWGSLSLLLSCSDSQPQPQPQAPKQQAEVDSLKGSGDPVILINPSLGDTLWARTLLDSAQTLTSYGNYTEALVRVQEAMDIYLELVGENDTLTAQSYLLEGKIYLLDQQPELALQATERGMAILRLILGENHMKYADALNLRGIIARRSGQDSLAIHYFRQSLAIAETQSNVATSRLEKGYYNLSLVFLDLNLVDSAEFYIRESLAIRKRTFGELHLKTASAYNQIGKISRELGRFDSAMAYHRREVNIKRNILGPRDPQVAYAQVNLAGAAWMHGDFSLAKSNYHSALELLYPILGHDHPQLEGIYRGLGIVSERLGQYEKALSFYQRSLAIQLTYLGEENTYVTDSYNNIGNVYWSMRQFDQALANYQEALTIQQKILDAEDLALSHTYHNIGGAHLEQQNFDTALLYYQRSLAIKKANDLEESHPDMAETYNNLGNAQRGKKNYPLARAYHQKALNVMEGSLAESHPMFVGYRLNLGLTYLAEGNQEQALSCLNQAARQLNFNSAEPRSFDQVSDLKVLHHMLLMLEMYYRQKWEATQDANYLDSISQQLTTMLALEEYKQTTFRGQQTRQFYAAQALPIYEAAIKHTLDHGQYRNTGHIFDLMERTKNRQLVERLQFDADRLNFGVPDSLLRVERELESGIAKIDKQIFRRKYGGDPPLKEDSLLSAYEKEAFHLQRRRDSLLYFLGLHYPAYHQLRYQRSVSSLEEVRKYLLEAHHGALLEYFVGDSALYTCLVLPDTAYLWERERDFHLEAWIAGLREAVLAQDLGTFAHYAHQLYQKLFAAVDGLLPQGCSILVVPDGVLGYLPFEVLLTEMPDPVQGYADSPYLLKKYPISYAYSATLQQEMHRKQHQSPPSRNLLAVAPTFNGDSSRSKSLLASRFIDTTDRRNLLSALAYNLSEAQSIAERLDGDLLMGEAATEEAFLSQASDYRILHLSTHGKANDQAGDYSFLAFQHIEDDSVEVENEWLYNSEIYNLQLNADLVVLSACETGIGQLQRGEGIISLARGFSYAGAKSLVTSLWNVNDRSSMELMEGFYGYLAEGQPKHLALRQAKLDYLESHPAYLQSPYYWAAFIAIGDMEPVKLSQPQPWRWFLGVLVFMALLALAYWRWRQPQKG